MLAETMRWIFQLDHFETSARHSPMKSHQHYTWCLLSPVLGTLPISMMKCLRRYNLFWRVYLAYSYGGSMTWHLLLLDSGMDLKADGLRLAAAHVRGIDHMLRQQTRGRGVARLVPFLITSLQEPIQMPMRTPSISSECNITNDLIVSR